MTKYNLLEEIKTYGDLAYEQGLKVGKGAILANETLSQEAIARLYQYAKVANKIGELIPSESIEAITKERIRKEQNTKLRLVK